MTPEELHTAVLAALDAAADTVADAEIVPWYVGHSPGPFTRTTIVSSPTGGEARTVATDVWWREAHLVVALRNTASATYRGVRRILERHHPIEAGFCHTCWSHPYLESATYPCQDYRDAALAVPHLPEEAARALRQ